MKKKRNKYRCGQRTVRLAVVESNPPEVDSHGHLSKLTPNNQGYVQGKPAVGDTWDKSGKPYGQIREGHAFQMPTMHSGHSRLIISVSVKFQSTPRAFPTNPDMVGKGHPDLLVLDFH
ncbi:hypothetical protein TNCV_360501 [Trichonephila clavipes]|nr:hypothetical protein TNCV_360501 [Trichonephila clavipes]